MSVGLRTQDSKPQGLAPDEASSRDIKDAALGWLVADSVVLLLLRRNEFDFQSDFAGFGNGDGLAELLELPQDIRIDSSNTTAFSRTHHGALRSNACL